MMDEWIDGWWTMMMTMLCKHRNVQILCRLQKWIFTKTHYRPLQTSLKLVKHINIRRLQCTDHSVVLITAFISCLTVTNNTDRSL